MNSFLKEVKQKAEKNQIVRGCDPFLCSGDSIDSVTDIIFEVSEPTVMSQEVKPYEKTWVSFRKVKKNTYKPMPKFDRAINVILSNLRKDLDISIRHTFNKGPEYTYYTGKEAIKLKDWICIPKPDRFENNKLYYKTILHELGHASCSRARLCMKYKTPDEEEMSVEYSALIISFLLGFNVWEDCLSYITNWNFNNYKESPVVKTCRDWKSLRQKTKRVVKYMLFG